MSEVYLTPEQKIRQRYNWFLEAQSLGNVSLACKRLGISRETFYKWKGRFEAAHQDRSALLDHSRRPYYCPRSVKRGLRRRILQFRRKNRLGPLRLLQLLRNHGWAAYWREFISIANNTYNSIRATILRN